MMVCCDDSSEPYYSKILSISNASDTFTVLLFSPGSISDKLKLYYFLIYCLISSDRSWLSHVEIMLSFPSYYLFLGQFVFGDFLSDRFLLAHVTGMSALLQIFGWDDQYHHFLIPVRYCCTVSTKSCR